MKYFYLILICFLFIITETNAGTPIKPFEVEISVGGTYGIGKYVGKNQVGPAFVIEGRFPSATAGREDLQGAAVIRYFRGTISRKVRTDCKNKDIKGLKDRYKGRR